MRRISIKTATMIVIDDGAKDGPASYPLMVHIKVVIMVPGQGTQTRAGSSAIKMVFVYL